MQVLNLAEVPPTPASWVSIDRATGRHRSASDGWANGSVSQPQDRPQAMNLDDLKVDSVGIRRDDVRASVRAAVNRVRRHHVLMAGDFDLFQKFVGQAEAFQADFLPAA